MREMHREPEVEECFDCPARITSKELAPIHSLKKWHPPECLFYKSESGCRFGDKSAVAMLKSTRQLGCVFQDMEPPKSSTILRKGSHILKPNRCIRFTKAVLRHANIRDQNPSLGMICPGDLISVTPMLQNLRIGLKKRRSGKSDVPVKQRGGWSKISKKLGRET